ncbi:MAG: SCP2 sterol-binding domain-containing protein [Methylococcales bacterium]
MLLRLLSSDAVERALNQLITLDPDSAAFLAPLAGKTIEININPPQWRITLCITNIGVQILEGYTDSPDTIISGSPTAFVQMLVSESPMRSLFSGDLTINGDMETGRKFQTLFKQLDIDWEEQLSRITGDIAAHKVGNIFRAGQKWGFESLNTFSLNLSEFIQEESRIAPTAIEADHFFDNVDTLREDYDRLQARMNRLQENLSS